MRILIERDKLEDLIIKVSSIPAVAVAIIEQINEIRQDTIQEKLKGTLNLKNNAINLGFVLENYSSQLYADFNNLFENAEDYKEQ